MKKFLEIKRWPFLSPFFCSSVVGVCVFSVLVHGDITLPSEDGLCLLLRLSYMWSNGGLTLTSCSLLVESLSSWLSRAHPPRELTPLLGQGRDAAHVVLWADNFKFAIWVLSFGNIYCNRFRSFQLSGNPVALSIKKMSTETLLRWSRKRLFTATQWRSHITFSVPLRLITL